MRVKTCACLFLPPALLTGCRSKQETSVSSTGSSAPPAVSLPDLSKMEPSVQRQIREKYSSLVQKKENSATPKVELGTAYGELGNLLSAAEQLDLARSCYLNAQVLAPDDARWPYYLGHVYKTTGELAKSAAAFERAVQHQTWPRWCGWAMHMWMRGGRKQPSRFS